MVLGVNRRLHSLTALGPKAQSSGAPNALLDVVGRDDRGLVVDLGSVLIEGGGGLRAEVAFPEVEVEGANAVRTTNAGELYASLDPLGGVGAHGLIVSPRWRGNGARWSVGEGNGANAGLTTNFCFGLLVQTTHGPLL